MNALQIMLANLAAISHIRKIADALGVTIADTITLVIGGIQQLEQQYPQAARGREKAEALRALVVNGFELAGRTLDDIDRIWQTVAPAVSAIVAIYNARGIFKNALAQVSAVAAPPKSSAPTPGDPELALMGFAKGHRPLKLGAAPAARPAKRARSRAKKS